MIICITFVAVTLKLSLNDMNWILLWWNSLLLVTWREPKGRLSFYHTFFVQPVSKKFILDYADQLIKWHICAHSVKERFMSDFTG